MKKSNFLLTNLILIILIITLNFSACDLDQSLDIRDYDSLQLETTIRDHTLFRFYENRGQINDTDLQFYGQIDGGFIGLATGRIFFWDDDISTPTIMQFDTEKGCMPRSKQIDSHRVNFFMGSRGSFTNIKTSSAVEYADVWQGVDLILKYSSGAIEFDFNGISDEFCDYNVIITTPYGIDRVVSITDISSILSPLISEVVLEDTNAFTISEIDLENPLIFSTCIGGTGYDYSNSLDIDSSGNIYIGGNTESTFFPIFGGIDTELVGESNLFVIKMSENGDQILFATFIGGNNNDYVYDLELDAGGDIILVGETSSSDFPFTTHFDSSIDAMEGFLLELDADGNDILSATTLGGFPTALEIDNENNIVITGDAAPDLPTLNAFDSSSNGGGEIFLMKVNYTNTELIFSTFIGGSNHDYGYDVAVDFQCNIYLTGMTHSSDFPIINGFSDTLQGDRDAFVLKFNSSGTGISYSTFLGGSTFDFGYAIEVDILGNAYVVGTTHSANFPLMNPFQSSLIGENDAFVTKLNASGTGLVFSTLIGGDSWERPYDIEVASDFSVYIAGTTQSSDYPMEDPYRDYLWSGNDIFLTRFNSSGSSLLFSTYFGGDQNEQFTDILIDSNGILTVTGMTSSDVFPTVNDYDNPPNGYVESFVAKFYDLADQDDDLLRDYLEEFYGTLVNCNDSDFDNISDYAEIFEYFTDPLNNDSDFDLVSDYLEIYVYDSNPLSNDSDSDSLNDFDEIFTYGTDPNSSDTDLDSLSDAFEVFEFGSNPTLNDTDWDLLNDSLEYALGTNPNSADSDNDTLSDYTEVFELGTNPLSNDTDGDSYSDAWEIENGFDPLDPLDPPEVTESFREWNTPLIYGTIGISLVVIGVLVYRMRRSRKYDWYDF